MVNHPDIFENYIKEAAKREIESIPVPNMEDVWLNIEENLYKKQKKNNSVLVRRIAFGVAAVLLISLSFTNEYTRAIGYITEVLEKTVAVQIDLRKDGKKVSTLTLEEAKQRAGFPISIPQVLPNGYTLKEVKLNEQNKKTSSTELIYSNANNENIKLIQATLEKATKQIEEVRPFAKVIETKTEVINGIAYKIISFDDGYRAVYWEAENMKYLLEGMEKDLQIDIALSIK